MLQIQFLRDKQPGYTATLLRTRVLPVYTISEKVPYLVAAANWVVGELSSCLPEVRITLRNAISARELVLFEPLSNSDWSASVVLTAQYCFHSY